MQYQNFSCNVLPLSDKKVLKVIDDALNQSKIDPLDIICNFKHIKDPITIEKSDLVGTNLANGIVNDPNSSLLKNITVTLIKNDITFRYVNNIQTNNTNTRATAEFNFQNIGDDRNESWKTKLGSFISTIRKGLGATDGIESLSHILGDDAKAHLATREQELVRLEGVADTFFERLQEFEAQREKDYLQQQAKLDERLISKSEELETEYQKKAQILSQKRTEWETHCAQKQTELQEWEARLEALNNTDERRQTRKQIRNELEKRETQFALTQGTQSKRKPVHTIFLSIILGALCAFGIFLWLLIENPTTDTWTRVVLIARVALAGVVFFTTLIYYLRWNMEWFERHASEEFRNKRQIVDMDRATWLSEFALEWHGVTESEMPSAMFEALSRELYVTDGGSPIRRKNAADVVASALFGSAATVRGKLGNAEVELDRKSSKKMEKEKFY